MNKQLTIDFVHELENNPDSQRHLELKREDFNAQCWVVLKRMLNGEKLTYLTSINSGIGDIRRRAKDLIDSKGIPVKREWAVVDGVKQDYKWYYISPEDRENIMRMIKEISKP